MEGQQRRRDLAPAIRRWRGPGVVTSPDAQPFAADRGPVGIVLCHGFTGSPASLLAWAQHLAEHGITVRLPLLPGHGMTWREANRSRWPQWYGAVEEAFSELSGRCERVFAGGLSMGGC